MSGSRAWVFSTLVVTGDWLLEPRLVTGQGCVGIGG